MARSIKENDAFKEKLLKLIPSEIVAAYVAIQGFLQTVDQQLVVQIVIGVLGVITFLYLHRIEQVQDLKHKLFSTATFFVWVYAVAPEEILGEQLHNPPIGSIVLILWTLLIPLVVGQGRGGSAQPAEGGG